MADEHPDWVAHQRKRFMRENAHLYIRHDAYRFMPPGSPLYVGKEVVRYDWPEEEIAEPERPTALAPVAFRDVDDPVVYKSELASLRWHAAAMRVELALIKLAHILRKAGFDPNQPRVPAGNPDGGQWTTEEGDDASDTNDAGDAGGLNESLVLSDAPSEDELILGAQYAQNRPRGSVSVRIGGRLIEVEGGRAARLVEAQTRAESAIARVRELDPNWRPTPSAYESVEGLIRRYDAEAREAQSRASELARVGIGPGPFAGESIPARGPERTYNAWERSEGRRIFSETGCHTCGTSEPGTLSGNPVLDHQPPNALNPFSRSQRLYPQCLTCSLRQGNWLMRYRARGCDAQLD